MITTAILFELAWKSLLVAGAALGLLRLARGRSAAERSWIAHLGLLSLLLLPVAIVMLPAWTPLPAPAEVPAFVQDTAPVSAMPDGMPAPVAAETEPSFAPSLSAMAIALYLLPLVLLGLAMLVAVVRLFAMHRRAAVMVEAPWLAALAQAQRRMGFKHGTALLVSDELRSPISWGLMRPIILLNPGAVEASREAEAIIAHELAHVARLDWAKLLIARVACALFWFNPLVWRLARESHQLREEAADDAVLQSDVDGADYASLLVNAARHDNKALLLAAHGVAPAKNSLKRRIARVLDGTLSRRPATATWVALCVGVVIGAAGPLAALDPLGARPAAPVAVAVAPVAPTEPDVPQLPSIVAQVAQDATRNAVAAVVGGDTVTGLAHPTHAPLPPATSHRRPDGQLSASQLTEMRAVGVTDDYVRELESAGFRGLSADELVEARAVGVSAAFARQMRAAVPGANLDDLVEARAVGLTPDYIRQMRGAFPGAPLDDLVGARAVGVSGEFASQMRQLFRGVSLDDVVELRAVGVTPEYVRSMRSRGIALDDTDDAVEARVTGSWRGPGRPGPRPAVVPHPPRVPDPDPDPHD